MTKPQTRMLGGFMNNWQAIRKFYKENAEEIMSTPEHLYGVDPYWWEDFIEMTPIEKSMWCDIRCSGVVMYPQLPVGKFFVDFGNPRLKIAIECDGKQWHDPKKDAERDAILKKLGWTIYRFTGSECIKTGNEFEDEIGRIYYKLSNVEKFLANLRENPKTHFLENL
jgi:very-short-patch-repair endonuclease